MSLGETTDGNDLPYAVDTQGYLTLGQSAFGWITGSGDVGGDWDAYYVYLQAGTSYSFFSTGTSVQGIAGAGHMYLELYNASKDFLRGQGPDLNGSVTMTYTPVTSGDYYLAVSGDDAPDFGGYRVALTTSGTYPDDHGAEFWNAPLVAAGRYYGTLERVNDSDGFLLN